MGLLGSSLGGRLSDLLRGEGTGRYRGQLAGLIGQERESDKLYGDATIEALRRGNEARVAGYDQAIGKASDISRASRREATTRAEGMMGELTSRMGAGGKFGTTALDNARLGLGSALTRELEGIDAAFSGLMSELAVGKGSAIGEGERDIAAFQQGRSEQESELFRLLTGTLKQPRPGMLGGVLGAAGAGLGSMFGGPAGGTMGGEIGSALGSSFERD